MCAPRSPKSVVFTGIGRWARERRALLASLAVFSWALGAAVGCSSPQARYKILSVFFDGVPNPDAKVSRSEGTNGDSTAVYKKPTNSVHKPFAANDCAACHTGGAEGAFTRGGSESVLDSNVCMKCHEPIPNQFAAMHAPVAAKACLFCHNPHESSQPHLLIEPAPMLCTQCHDRSLLGSKPVEHRDPKANCLECHMGHGGNQKFFLRIAPATRPSAPTAATDGTARSPVARASRPCEETGNAAGRELSKTGGSVSTDETPVLQETTMPHETTSPTTQPVVSSDRPLTLLADLATDSAGPIVIGERQQTQFFHLDPIQPTLELRYLMENDKIDQHGGTSTHFTENRLEEDINLKSSAYIIHPNLVDMKLSGTFGPRQDWFDTDGQSGYGRELLYDYDVSGTILRKEDAPVTLYSRRSTGLITRQFGPSFDNTVMTSGGIIDWQSKVVPTRIEAFHSDQVQKSLDGTESFTLSENTATLHSEARPTTDQRLVLNYTFSDITENNKFAGPTGSQTNSFDTHDVLLSHSADFGANRQHNFSSSVSFFDESGDFPLERLRWDERLLLRHTPNFETRYQYSLDYQSSNLPSFGSIDQTEHTAIAGFTHRLYQSLVTSGSLGFRELDRTGDTGSTGYFANINTDYHKQVPLGRLNITAGYAFDQQENRAAGTVTHIANSSLTFTDPVPIILPGGNVLASSIVVRDATGLIIYTPGADYLVRVFPDRVELQRVIGGRILNGQAVLISYDLSPQPANTVTDNTVAASLRYDFQQGPLRGLGLYARYTNLDQHIDSARPALFVPNSVDDTTIGTEYRLWEIVTGAEQEWHHSEIAPYDAARFFARFQHRAGQNTTLGVTANYSLFHYSQEHNNVDMLTITGTAGHSFTSTLYGSVSATYLYQDDQIFGITQGLEGTAEVRWQYRQTTVYAQFRQSFLDTRAQTSSFQSAYVGIRREF